MGYLQMQLMNETTETFTIGICLNIDKFYADLDFTANSDFEKWDEYPIERFHEKMRVILEEMENKQQELPLLFSNSSGRRNVIPKYYILLQFHCHG